MEKRADDGKRDWLWEAIGKLDTSVNVIHEKVLNLERHANNQVTLCARENIKQEEINSSLASVNVELASIKTKMEFFENELKRVRPSLVTISLIVGIVAGFAALFSHFIAFLKKVI